MQLTTTKKKPGPQPSLELTMQRFWDRVDQSAGRFGCWPWLGSRKEKGYGQFNFMGKTKRSHRVAYELEFGEIPDGLLICHVCDNPPCCNPWHLVAATAKDNTTDMIHKGRANFYNNLPNLRSK